MLVQCPNCKTTYKVSDELVKGSSPAFRCSRCKHTFELEPAESALSTVPETLSAEAKTTAPKAHDAANQPEMRLAFTVEEEITRTIPQQPELPEIDAKSNAAAPRDSDDRWSI